LFSEIEAGLNSSSLTVLKQRLNKLSSQPRGKGKRLRDEDEENWINGHSSQPPNKRRKMSRNVMNFSVQHVSP